MSVNEPTTSSKSPLGSELLFLIARFLSNGPCQQAANVLVQELQKHELFPKGCDWEGNPRTRTYDELVRMNGHVGPDYLLQLCQRLGPLLDQLVPTETHGVRSLLGAGKTSLLRTPESVRKTIWKLTHLMVVQNGCTRLRPKDLVQPSMVQCFHARRAVGTGITPNQIPASIYTTVSMHDRKLGHLSAVYCVTFDRTGQYIITGADDALVKIWHARSGRLLATLRGHASEITDMAINYENTLLATGSIDKYVRVWCLKTKAPMSVLQGHTGHITTVQFSPQCKGDIRILMSSGSDGCVCFWLWNASTNTFNPKPKKFVERSHAGAQMLCTSFSPGGIFVATGNSDHVIRVYFLYASEPCKICELESHTNKVDSICYSNFTNRFVSGSEDGTARIWHYERQEWRATILSMATKLNSDGTEILPEDNSKVGDHLRVTMVSWNLDDSLVVTAVSDYTIKVWDSHTGKLLHILKAHEDDVYVLDSNPVDAKILLSAGHDGHIILWNIWTGVKIKSFFNNIQGQGHGAVYDCKFTPDGQSFAATDSHGHLLFFGFGANEEIKKVPQEVFFHTDYRPLIRDANNFVLDEQTQQPPHLMPPPFLVNIDGNPYPPIFQKLVPGREKLKENQLVPEIGINEAGDSEVIGDQDALEAQREAAAAAEALHLQQHNHLPPPSPHAAEAQPTPHLHQSPVEPHQQDHDYSRHEVAQENAHLRNGRDDEGYDEETDDEETEDSDNDDEGGGRLDDRARPSIDEMILRLQQEQDERILAQGGELPIASPPPPPPPPPVMPAPAAPAAPAAPRPAERRSSEGRVGLRRIGEMEGVRQSLGNMQQRATSRDLAAWKKRVVIQPVNLAMLKTSERKRLAFADDEINKYLMERKKKQAVPNTPSTLFGNMSRFKQQQPTKAEEKKKKSQHEETARNRLTTRALYDTEEEEEEEVETEHSDRDSDDSSYSDWTCEGSSNLQPPKRRSARKPKRRQVSSSDDEDEEDEEIVVETDDDEDEDDNVGDEDDDDEEYKAYIKKPKKTSEKPEEPQAVKTLVKKKLPAAPKTGKTKKPSKRKSAINRNNLPEITELKEEFRPPEWLTGTIPRKTPYVPQMGDEVMYFRQGHELYLQAVEKHKSYEISSNVCLPWQKNPHLREMELVKIVGIRYEVKPPRLCSLKLAYYSDQGKMSGGNFTIRYHDMPDVIDFLVLKQHFEIAYERHWKPGARFRSMIDDQWWMGKIESQSPLNRMFTDSLFQCFVVNWDNGEYERLSPWDMEPINENLLPSSVGGGVPVDPEELKDLLYTPKPNEWSSQGRESETERILQGLEAVMGHSAAEPFNAPVDLNAFPLYAMIIEYPIDLSTIKARLENGYYRRINALQWDMRHILSNAKKFNEDGTPICRSAAMITDTLLRFCSDPSCEDPMPVLDELSRGQKFSWGSKVKDEDKDDGAEGTSSGGKRKRGEGDERRSKRQRTEPPPDPNAWKQQCSDLLSFMLECEDAGPFKEPVNREIYPNYYNVIENPMDLGTVEGRLVSEFYSSPVDFAKDVRLIFHNSRNFNTNKRSRIFSMTLRLSAMFEERVQKIFTTWRAAAKSKTSVTGSARASTSSAAADSTKLSVSTGQSGQSSVPPPQTTRSRSAVVARSQTSGRSSEERTKTALSTRRSVTRPPVDSDSDKTEVEDGSDDDDDDGAEGEAEGEEGEAEGRDSSDKENYNEDEDTEIEEDDSPKAAAGRHRTPGAAPSSSRRKNGAGKKGVSNGHESYRTRAKTGSLRPKRYMSSDEDEDKDVAKNTKRAPSYSSRESSLHLVDEEDDNDGEESSSGTHTSSDTDHSGSRRKSKKTSKTPHRTHRKSASKSSRSKSKRRHNDSSEDEEEEEEDTDVVTEDSDSEAESGEGQTRKPKPKRRATVEVERSSGKKQSGSGSRTTRNQGKRTFNYLEDSDDEYGGDPTSMSVSSRGRIRKMTKRARANRVDD
ncbi:PH-interacting protein-like [Littorina saxatilis]|uniref:Bromo domain-containing protein n=1 Tax=Littorina saxatilis TaxID=31220 RepID=A0AAN9BSD3_9CAEN